MLVMVRFFIVTMGKRTAAIRTEVMTADRS